MVQRSKHRNLSFENGSVGGKKKEEKSHPRIVSATSVQRLLLRVLVTYDM